jgi:hypothetical protein
MAVRIKASIHGGSGAVEEILCLLLEYKAGLKEYKRKGKINQNKLSMYCVYRKLVNMTCFSASLQNKMIVLKIYTMPNLHITFMNFSCIARQVAI